MTFVPGTGASGWHPHFVPVASAPDVGVNAVIAVKPPVEPEITLTLRIGDPNAIRDLFLVLHGRGTKMHWARMNALYNAIGWQLQSAGIDLARWLREGQVA